MRHNKLSLFAHIIMPVAEGSALIRQDVEYHFHGHLTNEAGRRECTVEAIGGTVDHVHILLEFPASLALTDLAKHLQKSSANYAGVELKMAGFKWQGPFAAATVSRWDRKKLVEYIQNQREHHARGTTKAQLEFQEV